MQCLTPRPRGFDEAATSNGVLDPTIYGTRYRYGWRMDLNLELFGKEYNDNHGVNQDAQIEIKINGTDGCDGTDSDNDSDDGGVSVDSDTSFFSDIDVESERLTEILKYLLLTS